MNARFLSFLVLAGALLLDVAWGAATSPGPPAAAHVVPIATGAGAPEVTTSHVAVLTADQVLQILDETVDWYRTLGTQQQSSTQPSDLLILYANQQTATQVVNLAFDLARANAELLSSEAGAESNGDAAKDAGQTLAQRLHAERQTLQAEFDDARVRARSGSAQSRSELEAKASELKGELDMLNARLNLSDMMATFVDQNNARMASANALKTHIDAIAASVPGLGSDSAATGPAAATASTASTTANVARPSHPSGLMVSADDATPRAGLWWFVTHVVSLAGKASTILAIDQRTATLEQVFAKVRSAPMERLTAMSQQSDALASRADSAHGAALQDVRSQLDTLAWLFQQTSNMLVPLIKEGVLLDQYRRNLSSWHETVERQYRDALRELAIRAAVLLGVLALVFAGGEVWRRMVLRYTSELRRRQQLLLIRKLTIGAIVLIVIGLTFFTELGSFATFAGLITAGVAVAMQSVLTCIVGYFLLIGKYGLRVGDRVQVGSVAGEIIDLGLIRLHLMEFGADGRLTATGRVVAFPNSIVFQATGGLFRQIPGVSLVWHEIIVTLPAGRDYATFKAKLLPLLSNAMQDYHDVIEQQSRQIEQSTASASVAAPAPQVQLRLSGTGAEVVVRYPVQLERAAEIDEKISQAVSTALGST
ncbi:MAG TPA: mechanosensitive ion channel family protein [Steroidobacteraceae bacterium]|jgi:small-conductance mechanosensitive channel|nr:mechanosensitive ion channel family protein [Steroidobacteraceae bacterium]